MSFRKSSFFIGRNVDDDTYSGSFEGEFTGSVSATLEGEFTGTLTGSLTGAVAVLSSGSGKEWARSTGSDAGGAFNANNFTFAELGPRFAALVDELLVFIPLPPPPPSLPSLSTLTLYYDTREQGDTTIIDETQNALNMQRPGSASFTFRTGPPSVDMEAGVDAVNPNVDTSIMRANADGISTIMILIRPANSQLAYVTDYSNGHNIILGFVADQFEFFVGGGESTGDDPRSSTQIPATASVWQTVCYTVDVDGLNKQNGYHNGVLSIGPLSKSFDLTQATDNFEIGHVAGGTDFTGSFGAYLHWTSSLSAQEVKDAHNFLRSIDAGYGLPEAL